MNVASHFLMAIFCQIIINLLFPIEWWSLLLVAVVAFLSHFFIDAIVERFTFHPRFPDKHPKAVLITTICEIILGIIVALYFSQFWLSILFSVVVDIYDWIILRAILKKDFKEDYKLYLHQYCDKIQDT
ncbi:MAG: hypothetical protein GY870_04240, partial [archaeon]|nr:hypothetical protein [archaeon]